MALDIVEIPVKLRIKTGLHIGGGEENYEIGGVDRPFIKTRKLYSCCEVKEEPYIPGSSLKGKLRSLLECKLQLPGDDKNGEPHKCDKEFCVICDLFGRPSYNKEVNGKKVSIEGKQSTIRVSDFFLTEEFRKSLDEQTVYEYKTENTINRITGAAANRRTTERIVPGVEFEGKIRILFGKKYVKGEEGKKKEREYTEEEKKKLKEALWNALNLLEKDYLGSDGSRGYGAVEIVNKEEIKNELGIE